MNQTLHIFKKDARRFWIEILLSLAITAAFVFLEGRARLSNEDTQGQTMRALANLLATLVPVSWWVLIARAILAERLVGDTQFWITRPYGWRNLLAAKALFVVVFLYVPFSIALCALLLQAGFTPHAYMGGILFNLLLLTGAIILPLAAIASVTSSFARTTLTMLGIFLGFIILASIIGFAFGTSVTGIGSHVGADTCLALALVIFSTVIGLQYALRRAWISRTMLLTLPLLLVGALYFAGKYDQARVDRDYPLVQGDAPIQLTYSPDPRSYGSTGFQVSAHVMIPVSFHLIESGVGEGYAVMPDAIRGEITAPDGSHWSSDWQGSERYRLLPGDLYFSPRFSIPIDVLTKYQGVPLKVHLSLALTQAQAERTTTLALPPERFSVPGFGVCVPQSGWLPIPGQIMGINCVAALREPPLTYISTRWSDAPCTAANGPEAGALGTAWVGSLDRQPAEFGISSIADVSVNLSNNQNQNGSKQELRYLCAGTPVTFTQFTAVRRMQIRLDIQDFYLPRYSVTGNMITVTE